MTEISLTTNKPITKSDIDTISANIIESLNNGEDPLLLLAKKKALEKIFENVESLLRDYCNRAAEKYPSQERKTGFQHVGFIFKSIEAGTRYDFTNTNDPIWTDLNKEMERAKLALKQREDFLKTIDGSEKFITQEGEEITIHGPIKKSTTTVSVTIK